MARAKFLHPSALWPWSWRYDLGVKVMTHPGVKVMTHSWVMEVISRSMHVVTRCVGATRMPRRQPKSKDNNSFNTYPTKPVFELDLHLPMEHLYTKHYLDPSNLHWENERKLSFSRNFQSPRAITPSILIRPNPYSNLTCISPWYICIPNIIKIHQTFTEKMNGNQNGDGMTEWRKRVTLYAPTIYMAGHKKLWPGQALDGRTGNAITQYKT